MMKLDNVEEGAIVCFRYREWKKWILICPLKKEIKDKYIFAHKKPSSYHKDNIEPIFSEAVYECIERKQLL